MPQPADTTDTIRCPRAWLTHSSLIRNILAVGNPLAETQREAEHGLEFARKVRFGFVIDLITALPRLICTLRDLTPTSVALWCFLKAIAHGNVWRTPVAEQRR